MHCLALITTAECRLFHAPRGGDSGASSFVPTARIFQSTPPTRGATALCVPMFCGSLFQSTPPRGGRLRQPAQGSGASDHFNPRPREGGDDVGFVSRVPPSSISIHAPREGGRHQRCCLTCSAGGISIHAPREGGDFGEVGRVAIMCYFNPRPPRGGDCSIVWTAA